MLYSSLCISFLAFSLLKWSYPQLKISRKCPSKKWIGKRSGRQNGGTETSLLEKVSSKVSQLLTLLVFYTQECNWRSLVFTFTIFFYHQSPDFKSVYNFQAGVLGLYCSIIGWIVWGVNHICFVWSVILPFSYFYSLHKWISQTEFFFSSTSLGAINIEAAKWTKMEKRWGGGGGGGGFYCILTS